MLAGAALAELGLVATTPAVVGLAGRLGALLPAAPRLALRDAARHRTRTAPAVAAVLAAVAGTVGVSTYVSSLERDAAAHYLPLAGPGALIAAVRTDDHVVVADVSRVLQRGLPGAGVIEVRTATAARTGAGGGLLEVAVPPEAECPSHPRDRLRPDPRCGDTSYASVFEGDVLVGGPDVAVATAGVEPATAQVLTRGGRSCRRCLDRAPAAGPVGAGRPRARRDRGARRRGRRAQHAAHRGAGGPAPRRGARRRPRGRRPGGAGLPGQLPDRSPGAAGRERPAGARRVRHRHRLAAADGRADLSTLAAVGASPGVRRLLAGSQSLVTAGLGTLLGTVAGLVPAVGLIRALNAPDSTGYVRPSPSRWCCRGRASR